jgi:hypothetical protein
VLPVLPVVAAVPALAVVVPSALLPPQLASGTAAAPANSQRSDWRRLVTVEVILSKASSRLW